MDIFKNRRKKNSNSKLIDWPFNKQTNWRLMTKEEKFDHWRLSYDNRLNDLELEFEKSIIKIPNEIKEICYNLIEGEIFEIIMLDPDIIIQLAYKIRNKNMRIEKTETVELLDWEKENGLEIVVVESWNSNKEKGFEYKSYVKSYINGCGLITFGFGDSINDSLISLCKRISGEKIGHEDFYIKRYTCTKQAFPPDYKIINCPLLVHTKLVEPNQYYYDKRSKLSFKEIFDKSNSEMNDFFNELNKTEAFKGCFKATNEQPPIDAEGWEEIYESIYLSKFYKPNRIDYFKIKLDLTCRTIFIDGVFDNLIIIRQDLQNSYIRKLSIETDDRKTQCFKIANYICSMLCDKIEK